MILNELGKIISNIVKPKYDVELKVIKSNRKELCDYQCNDSFALAKELHKSPVEIGEDIVSEINCFSNFNDYFKRVEFVKPGFINITVSDNFVNNILKQMNDNIKYNLRQPDSIETYFLDYGGPNVAKPLHVGHLRSAVVGESIKRIINYAGHKTICDVHLGDYGLQIGQVIYGIKKDNMRIEDLTLEYLEKTYPYIIGLCKENEEIKNECAKITKELQDGNLEYQQLWKEIVRISGNDILRIYKYLGVSFDIWHGESDAYPYIESLEKTLDARNLLINSEGAKVIDVRDDSDSKEMPPFIFQKSNGAYLYGTTDLATIKERMEKYNPDHIYYIADLRQDMHFTQVFRASKLAGLTTNTELKFCGFGTVNDVDGKPYKTRSGDAPKLDSLFNQTKEIFLSLKKSNKDMTESDIDKIVNAIIKFADLQNNREKDYIFDINKFSEVVGKTGPYILYTYLRINKIIKDEVSNLNDISPIIYNDADRDLRLKLIEFDLSFNRAFNEQMPSYIADYIYELCVLVNVFYQSNHISNLDDKTKKNDWIYVLNIANGIIKDMLHILVIDIPSVM